MADAKETADDRFGANLRAAREAREISQSELARRMAEAGQPWHQSTVARAEAGRQSVRVTEAEALAAILGTSIDRLLWSSPEANAVIRIEQATAALLQAWDETASSSARLLAASRSAEFVIAAADGADYPRARAAMAELAAELKSATMDAAVAEGAARFEGEITR